LEIKPHKIEGIGNVLLFKLIDEQTHLFNFIIREIYNCLEQISSKEESTPSIISLLDKIDSFFTKYQQGLSKSAQQGLYGELYFMFEYLFKEVEPLEALKFWRGHDRGTHDYVFPNGNLEIKTTAQKEHKKISINSEMQLNNNGLSNLFLYVLNIKKLETEGESLVEIIKKINDYLIEKNIDTIKFYHYLNQAGYFKEHNFKYESIKYFCIKDDIYEIIEGFPRIISLPDGTGDLKYSIALSSCKDFCRDLKKSLRALIND